MSIARPPVPSVARFLPALLALVAAACAAGGRSEGPAGAAAAAPARAPAAAAALIEWLRPAGLPGDSRPPAGSTGFAPSRAAVAGPGPAAAPRERVAIDLGGLWVGPENPQEGPRAHYLFARRERAGDLARLVRAYAPFRVVEQGDRAGNGVVAGGNAGGGGGAAELVFRGRGAAQASAAERRMIGEWTRSVAVEAIEVAADAGAPSSYGLAFAWHRGAATGGVCDDLVVYLTGEVRAGSCGAAAGVGGRLAGERLERLYAWIDGFAAFQGAGEQGLRADALLDRVIFAGRGRRRATPADVAAIEAFAGALHHELTAAAAALATAAAPAVPAAIAGAIPRTAAAAAPKTAPPEAESSEDASPADEPAAAPAEALPPAPRHQRQPDVSPEPDEAPPADALSPPSPPQPITRPVEAAPPPAAPPPAAAAGPQPRRPSRKRPAEPSPVPEASPPPPTAPSM